MRKVSSAPSLVEAGNRASLDHHQGPRMGPKSGSHGSLARLGGGHHKDEKRKGKTQALMSDSHQFTTPSDQILPEEFAESAKGLAGMDCFELYGGTRKAPELQHPANATDQQRQTNADDANAYALASCLNTPYTGEDKNLGEQVSSETNAETSAAVARLETQYQREVASQLKEQVADMDEADLRMLTEPRGSARRRRLMEILGLDAPQEGGGEALTLEEQSDIAQLLMTSLEEETKNRTRKPREWKRLLRPPAKMRRASSEEQPVARCAPRPLYSFADARSRAIE